MTKIERLNDLAQRVRAIRTEIEELYTDLWAEGLHAAKQTVDRAVPPLMWAEKSIECALEMEAAAELSLTGIERQDHNLRSIANRTSGF